MSDVLDELRKMAMRRDVSPSCPTLSIEDLDAFAEAHPGLMDTTTTCQNCRGKFARTDTKVVHTTGPTGAGYMATLCTHCAATLDMDEWYGFSRQRGAASTRTGREARHD